MTTGAVYKRYRGKEELFRAVVQETADMLDSFIALRHLGTDLIEAVRKANRVSAAVVGCPGALLDHEAFLKLGL